MSEICETGITWDHDTGDIWISTRRKGVAQKLRRLGLDGERGGNGYFNFHTDEKKFRLSFRKPYKRSRSATRSKNQG